MTYSVQINVMPLKELLDPQGKAVLGGLNNLGPSVRGRRQDRKAHHPAG